jgi:hypothetical protein
VCPHTAIFYNNQEDGRVTPRGGFLFDRGESIGRTDQYVNEIMEGE